MSDAELIKLLKQARVVMGAIEALIDMDGMWEDKAECVRHAAAQLAENKSDTFSEFISWFIEEMEEED